VRRGLGLLFAIWLLILLTRAALAAPLRYTVVPGDSLFSIGQRFGVSATALARYNGLTSNTIYPGQVLAIPGLTAYTVRPGDSLYLLGQRFGTTVAELWRLNALGSDRIVVGQTLAVPLGRIMLTSDEVYLLGQMIHAEAEAEPYLGKVAVGAVILNRIRHPLFPSTLRGVLFQPGQFEPIMNGWFWRPPGTESLRAAHDAVAGWDPTGGALYFYNPDKATNRWIFTRPIALRIGNHVFTY